MKTFNLIETLKNKTVNTAHEFSVCGMGYDEYTITPTMYIADYFDNKGVHYVALFDSLEYIYGYIKCGEYYDELDEYEFSDVAKSIMDIIDAEDAFDDAIKNAKKVLPSIAEVRHRVGDVR